MIARYADSSWIDIDSMTAFVCDMSDENPDKWVASFIVDGVGSNLRGKNVKNLYEAYKWKWGQVAYDMRVDSPRFKKQGE